MIEMAPADVLIAPPEVETFHGSNELFVFRFLERTGQLSWLYSRRYYLHPSEAESSAYKGAIQAISRSDILIAYIDDLEGYGTLVEIAMHVL